MRRGGSVLVMLGIVLGVLTAGGTFLVLSTAQPQAQQIPTRSVVIAQQNIPARTEISAETVGTAEWPEKYLPTGAYERTDEVVGKFTLEPIYQGQIILPPMIIDKKGKEVRSNASYLIPPGKIAVAFPITTLSGIAGAIQAGDTVDVFLTLKPPEQATTRSVTGTVSLGTEGMAATQLMLEDVPILQVGMWPTGGTQDKAAAPVNVITLVLDRQDALALKAARELGVIELALRPAGDHTKAKPTEPVTLQYLNKRFNFNLQPLGR